MDKYLFTYFKGEETDGEQIYFAVSEDGLFWKDMNNGEPMLISAVGTKGIRDPFPIYDPENKKYYIIATDLNAAAGGGWQAAKRYGSRDLLVWESTNLTDWSEVRQCTVGIPESGCVWAPEAVYDKEKEAFFVFFASWIGDRESGDGKQKIYACYTKDFKTFTKPFLYIEREDDVIDTTIVESDGMYFRISKNETTKVLIMEKGESLTGEFQEIRSELLESIVGIEGPQCYQLPDGKWCLIADCYSKGTGYFPMVTEDLSSGEFKLLDKTEYYMGAVKKRHGGVLRII